MTSLYEVITAARAARGWTMADFARRCKVSPQLAYKWLAEDPEQRITPGPVSCQKIATALDLDEDYVLELAGHRKPKQDGPPRPSYFVLLSNIEQQFDRWMEIMGPRLGHEEAAKRFWNSLQADAKQRNDIVEAALYSPEDGEVYRPNNEAAPPVKRTRKLKKTDYRTLSAPEQLIERVQQFVARGTSSVVGSPMAQPCAL